MVFFANIFSQIVDLVEACGSLSRAVWYLDESFFGSRGHGRVRCSKAFVALHSDTAFQVKLGDPGLAGEAYPATDVHWLPYELLLLQGSQQHAPSPMHCTVKGDVWALATTFWEVCTSTKRKYCQK